MNLYFLAGLAWVVSASGAFWYGTGVGKDGEIAKQATLGQVATRVEESAQKGAAAAIAANKPRNVTIRQEITREIKNHPDYVTCKHGPAGLRLVNEALAGQRPVAAGGGQLPGADAAD